MEPIGYPRLMRRVQGAMLDGVVIPVAAIVVLLLMSYGGIESGAVKAACAVTTILLLEPFAVSLTGGTVGHHLVGIRVRRISDDRRLNLGMALVRFIVKTVLGLFAFVMVPLTRRRQAIHDVAARSVVVYKSTVGLPDHELLKELTRDEEHRAYVSKGRRTIVIAAYWLICYVAWSIGIVFFVSSKCVQHGTCTTAEDYWMAGTAALALLLIITIGILGWRGLLYGCRKHVSSVV